MQRRLQSVATRPWVWLAQCVLTLYPWHLAAVENRTPLTQFAHRVWRFGEANLLGTPQDITQTADGYIWVSTSNGLFRFDGVRFTRWTPPAGESLPSNSMWHLLGTRDGSLYIGTDRGLIRVSNGHVHTYPDSPRWPGPFVEDSRGNVWMGVGGLHSAPSAVCQINDRSLHCLGTADGFACSRGLVNAMDHDGYLLIGSPEGLCRWEPGTPPGGSASIYSSGLVRSLAVAADGTVWAGLIQSGIAGLFHLSAGRWMKTRAAGADANGMSVSTLLVTRGNALWIGTSDDGLYRLTDGRLEHFDLADGLSDRSILKLFEGGEGGVWAVTPAGVEYFRDYAVATYTSKEGLIAGHAQSVAADSLGNVFLASQVLMQLRDSMHWQVNHPDGRPMEEIRTLFADSHNDLWIGRRNELLVRKPSGAISPIQGLTPADKYDVDCLTEDADHDMWASVRNPRSRVASLMRIHDRRVVAQFNESSVMGEQVLNALAPALSGGVWVGGSAHGLFRFHDGVFERVAAADIDTRVENLLQESDGGLWIVTQSGFVRYADGHARALQVKNGLPCANGVNILDDGRGSKWFYLHCGIYRVSDAELTAWWHDPGVVLHGRFFGALEGARSNLSNGSPARTPDGHLWSASDYSFQSIDSQHLPFNTVPPGVHIEKLVADGRAYDPGGAMVLPADTRQIELDYVGLSYRIPEQVQFRYRLQGHDAQWVDAGNRRQAFFNDLPSGTYVFRVVASNNDGVWNSTGAAVTVTILREWYETWPFRLVALLLVTIIAVLAYLYRLRAHAASLKRRFDERVRERTRLARDLHDTLLQTIQGSKMVADNAREHVNDPRLIGRSLDRLSDWLDRASAEGRAALEALRTSAIDNNDLADSLRRVAQGCITETAIELTVLSIGQPRELHPIGRDEIYRIAFEAIRNACAHSSSTHLHLQITYGGRFELEIRDDGHGMDEATRLNGRAGHFGLAGMRERASGLGGKLQINSDRRGTSIILVIPGHALYKSAYGWYARIQDLFLMRRHSRRS